MSRGIFMALALTLGLTACGDPEDLGDPCGPASGKIVNIVDGDTVDLESGVRLRYLLVDTPELNSASNDPPECFAEEARDLNAVLVQNKTVGLEYDEECEDRFDRTLAYVTLGERMVNRIMIERGYARVLMIPPNGSRYIDEFNLIEAGAEAADAGLWGACP